MPLAMVARAAIPRSVLVPVLSLLAPSLMSAETSALPTSSQAVQAQDLEGHRYNRNVQITGAASNRGLDSLVAIPCVSTSPSDTSSARTRRGYELTIDPGGSERFSVGL